MAQTNREKITDFCNSLNSIIDQKYEFGWELPEGGDSQVDVLFVSFFVKVKGSENSSLIKRDIARTTVDNVITFRPLNRVLVPFTERDDYEKYPLHTIQDATEKKADIDQFIYDYLYTTKY